MRESVSVWGGLLLAVAIGFLLPVRAQAAQAVEPELEVVLSTGKSGAALLDNSYGTTVKFNRGDTVSIQATDGNLLSGIYIIWNFPVKPWILTADDWEISCGENGYLHEYVELDTPAARAVIQIPEDGMSICDIRCFADGELPGDVQVWNPPCESADILLVAAHADDEILFLGGIIPTYGVEKGARVQVVHLAEFWTTMPVREHEKLDGLWVDGLKNYPVGANFKDVYAGSLEQAEKQHDSEEMTRYLVEQIRRFRPQVIVTHDFKGEYGHGFHMLTAKTVVEAVEKAAEETAYPETVETYGSWNTPKTYIHLWKENAIKLDLRKPIEAMEGKTALEVAQEAYKQHVSQQWCWFYVSDSYKYSCADFGLYRTTVGADENDNMLDNIKLYSVQEAEEQKRLQEAAERAALEAQRKAEEEKKALEAERLEAERKALEEAERLAAEEEARLAAAQADKEKRLWVCLAVGIGIVLIVVVAKLFIFRKEDCKKTQI